MPWSLFRSCKTGVSMTNIQKESAPVFVQTLVHLLFVLRRWLIAENWPPLTKYWLEDIITYTLSYSLCFFLLMSPLKSFPSYYKIYWVKFAFYSIIFKGIFNLLYSLIHWEKMYPEVYVLHYTYFKTVMYENPAENQLKVFLEKLHKSPSSARSRSRFQNIKLMNETKITLEKWNKLFGRKWNWYIAYNFIVCK